MNMLPPKSDPPQALYIPPQSNPPKLELLMQGCPEDDEPTVRMKIPPHLLERTGPNYGLMGAILFCLLFWAGVAYLIWR